MKIERLTKEQLLESIKNNEFNSKLLCKKKHTVILMSQSWCPQFLILRRIIKTLPEFENVQILMTIYDKDPAGQEFKIFKESTFQNHLIPYLRFYKNGILKKETNFISRDAFLQNIEQN